MNNNVIQNKYDFIILFDVKNGNPNGDPETGNLPRVDPQTRKGLVTDVCLKRKIRNYIQDRYGEIEGCEIFVTHGDSLEAKSETVYEHLGMTKEEFEKNCKNDKKGMSKKVREYMCNRFFDISTFGAVLTTFAKVGSLPCASLRGPVQLSISESIDEILPASLSITRCALANDKEAENKNNTMGTKAIVPYALYICYGHISACQAEKTNFTEEKLEMLCDAILHMFDDDHSAARGEMNVRKFILFKHPCKYGNHPAYELFDSVTITKNSDVLPHSFNDYNIAINSDKIPDDIEVIVKK